MKNARCAYTDDPDAFFADRGQAKRRVEAQKLCMDCPVTSHCENFRQSIDARFGIWAGKLQTRK